MSGKEYEEQRRREKQLSKEIAMTDIREWISKIPKEKANKPAIVVGSRTFTPEEIAKEVENDTEYGKEFAKILSKSKIEMSRRQDQ